MGYVSNHIKADTYIADHGRVQNSGRVNTWVAAGFQFGQYTIGGILSGDIKLGGDGKGGSEEKDVKVDKETQKQIENKKKELQNVYSEAGVSTAEAFNNVITSQKSKVEKLQSELNQIKTVASIQTSIKEYRDTAASLEAGGDEDAEIYESAAEELENNDLPKAQKKEEELKEAQVELARLQGLQGQAENIELEISRLQDSSAEPEVKYDVKEETNQLKEFNTALREFTSIKNSSDPKSEDLKDAAKKLMVAYYGGSGDKTAKPIIDNGTAQTAFRMIEKQVEAALAE